ncbi:hypothetical protein ACFP3U_00815 [Kitasatospora misakiensis]|uniref:Uncharacterized protein n=1 Tax=Kitasatospora misakiensis TaxID=67330 RepID=A0ABW0WZ59_9ACTN
MSVPGFTADSAVYRTNGHYRTTSGSGFAGHRQAITPQDGFCSLIECPVECRSACKGGLESAKCQTCLTQCRKDCHAEDYGPATNRRAVKVC